MKNEGAGRKWIGKDKKTGEKRTKMPQNRIFLSYIYHFKSLYLYQIMVAQFKMRKCGVKWVNGSVDGIKCRQHI